MNETILRCDEMRFNLQVTKIQRLLSYTITVVCLFKDIWSAVNVVISYQIGSSLSYYLIQRLPLVHLLLKLSSC